MSSVDSQAIKRRNRETVTGLRKRERAFISPLGSSRPSSVIVTEPVQSSPFVRQVLTEISSLQPIQTSQLHGSPRSSLFTRYRPSTCTKPGQTRTQSATKSRKEPSLPSALPAITSRTCGHVSGRMSQLAGSVEQLVLQDREYQRSCGQPVTVSSHSRHTVFDPTSHLLSRVVCSSCSNREVSAVHVAHSSQNSQIVLVDAQDSPWYRHHRPRAPEPPVSPPISHKSPLSAADVDCSVDVQFSNRLTQDDCRSSLSSSSLGSISDVNDANDKSPGPSRSAPYPVHCDLDLPALEMDIDDQENRYRLEDFPLPPPPDAFGEFELSPRPISTQELDQTPSPLVLGPLAPITNIFPSSGLVGSRQPKWSTVTHPTLGDVSHSAFVNWDSELEPTIVSASIPSPPPRLVEHLSELSEPPPSLIVPTPELRATSARGERLPDWSQLTRPTALKREAPDGAEQINSPQSPAHTGGDDYVDCSSSGCSPLKLHRNKWMIAHPAVSKRLSNTEVKVTNYSPKKSRTQLLVPSEHSAFLPVLSTAHSVAQHNLDNLNHHSTSACFGVHSDVY